jgi:hypothetical protein
VQVQGHRSPRYVAAVTHCRQTGAANGDGREAEPQADSVWVSTSADHCVRLPGRDPRYGDGDCATARRFATGCSALTDVRA